MTGSHQHVNDTTNNSNNNKKKKKKNKNNSISKSESIMTSSTKTTTTTKATSAVNENLDIKHISKWNVDTTIKWLISIGYQDCEQSFREHKINGRALLMLDEEDLKEVIKHNVGQRKNLYHIIKVLQISYNRFCNNLSSSFFSNATSSSSSSCSSSSSSENGDENDVNLDENSNSIEFDANSYESNNNNSNCNSNDASSKNKDSLTHRHLINESLKQIKKTDSSLDCEQMFKSINTNNNILRLNGHLKNHHHKKDDDEDDDENMMANFCENCLKKFDHSPYTNYSQNSNMPLRSYKGEKRKTFVSIVYLFITCLWTSFMLTVVHDRVPDMEKYPPLPDLILDNVPLIPWAFFATELIGLTLLITFLIILVFHKYRSIIFRRMCSLGGTIFFLRSITMLITSLSVPGIHIQCSSQRYGSFINKLYGAWNILSGVGLYVQGVRTCGDYMFSGHTVWLTLLTHFISEYTPLSMHWLHTMSWVANLFGLFFILGAHEHYSIDVFVAFYITSRLFLYYHSLANSKVLFQRDHKRVKIWFPLFSYFESNIHSIVPNEYEYPPYMVKQCYKFFKNKIIKKIMNGVLSSSSSSSSNTVNGNNSKKNHNKDASISKLS